MSSPTATPPIIRRSTPLARRLARARRSLVTVEFARRLAATLAISIAVFGGLILADWLFELPLETRRISRWLALAVASAGAAWTLVGLFTQRRSDEEIALMVEREQPGFDSRLIGAVQFAGGHAAIPDGAPVGMVEAMVGEAEREARQIQFSSIVDPKRFARACLALLAVLVAAGVLFFASGDLFGVLLDRAYGKDLAIPRQTSIVEADTERRVGIGDRVELSFLATGVLPEQGTLSLRYVSGRRESVPLAASTEEQGRYSAVIDDVPDSFAFRARINDAETQWADVTALERPAVSGLSAFQNYPQFTGLPPSQHAPGDFALFPGSEVAFDLVSTKPLKSAQLQFVNTGNTLDLSIEPSDPTLARGTFTVPTDELGGFTTTLVDSEDMDSRDKTVYRVTLLADRAPEIRITHPKRAEELVTRRARVLVRFEATDRFGVAAVTLRYSRQGETDVGTLPVTIGDGAPKEVDGEFDWEIADLEPPVSEGDVIDYWLEASDQNTTDSNVGSSERLSLKVVTPEEKRADLLGRASDAIGGVGEATADQERINQDLEQLIRDTADQ